MSCILLLLETGRNEEAEQELHSYLDEAERQLLAAFQEVAYQDHPKPV